MKMSLTITDDGIFSVYGVPKEVSKQGMKVVKAFDKYQHTLTGFDIVWTELIVHYDVRRHEWYIRTLVQGVVRYDTTDIHPKIIKVLSELLSTNKYPYTLVISKFKRDGDVVGYTFTL